MSGLETTAIFLLPRTHWQDSYEPMKSAYESLSLLASENLNLTAERDVFWPRDHAEF